MISAYPVKYKPKMRISLWMNKKMKGKKAMRKTAVTTKAKYQKSRITGNVPVILFCLCGVMQLTLCVLPVVLFVKLASMSYFVAFFFSFSCASTFLKLKKLKIKNEPEKEAPT